MIRSNFVQIYQWMFGSNLETCQPVINVTETEHQMFDFSSPIIAKMDDFHDEKEQSLICHQVHLI